MGTLKILEHTEEPFKDREEAGRLLAKQLIRHGLQNNAEAVVLGIPRGGVIIAHHICSMLNVGLDVVLSRKLGSPQNPELAIGAVSEDGKIFLRSDIVHLTNASNDYIKFESNAQLQIIRERLTIYREVLPKAGLENKTIIITDDGVATGATMQAAIWAAKAEKPRRVIAAIPVGPQESLQEMAEYADEIICLRTSAFFYAIGAFYQQFEQVRDEEVVAVLREYAQIQHR